MKYFNYLLIASLSALALAGCGESENEKTAREASERLKQLAERDEPQDFAEALGDVLGAIGEPVETVSAQDLKVMLPEEFEGLKRKSYSAKKTGMFGVNVSKAEAVYRSDSDPGELTLSIADIGSMKGVAAMGLNWIDLEIDEENENGFERTTDYNGYKSHQKMQKFGDRTVSDFTLFVGSRFVVQATGNNVDWEVVEKAVNQVPLAELAEMKDQGVASRE